MSLIRLSLRKKRFVGTTPPPAGGLAIPRGAVNGWGTAADMYDSVAVNQPTVLIGNTSTASAIALTARLGVRHFRDGATPSWNNFQTANFGRPFWNALLARNRALPAPTATDQGHPIFLGCIHDPWGPNVVNRFISQMNAFLNGTSTVNPAAGQPYRISWGAEFTPQALMQFHGGGHVHYNGDASPTATLPYTGNPLTNAQSPIATAECPWEIMSHLGGPNEPGFGGAGLLFGDGPAPNTFGFGFTQEARDMAPWMHALKVLKDQQVGQGYGRAAVTLSGNSRVVTEAGLVTTAPNIAQIPVVPFVVMSYYWVYNNVSANGPIGASSIPDMSKGSANEVDVGDLHPYNYADEPSQEQRDGTGIGYSGLTGWSTYFNSSRSPFNGSQNPTPSMSRTRDPARELPMFITEWGLADRQTDSVIPTLDVLGGAGPFPSPKDVNAEYTVRQYLLGWFWGIRRTYYYRLRDMLNASTSEENLGLYDFAGTIKPNGLAVRNMLKLIGFSEPSNNARKLNLTVSGYAAGTNTILQADGVTVARQTVKRLHQFQIQQDDDNWLLVLVPGVKLWSWIRGNRNAANTGWASLGNPTLGRMSPATETLTITLPQEITDAQVAWPTRGLTPNGASYTWTTPDDGLTWDTLTISGARQITVDIDRYTKIVKLTRGVPATPPTLPIVVPSVGSTPAALRTGSTSGPRLNLKGINVWGLPDDITNNVTVGGPSFHANQHTNRVAICNEVQSWGANCIRLRAHAADYNGAPSAATDSLTKTQILDRVVDWVTAAKAENMYTVICPWDGLDGPYSGANFPAQYTNTFQFYTDVFARLGDDPMVMYETPNEPNNISMAQWQTIMQGYSAHFRDTLGYTGVLVMDPPNWANSGGSTSPAGNPAGYSDATYSAVEAFDAARTGMGGKHQLVFAKHDYSNNSGYPGNVFSQTNWVNGMGGIDIKHLIWANEFGNFNAGGPDPDSNAQWAIDYSIAARDRWAAKTNYVGAAPFLFGPWSDLNAMTATPSNTTRTTWGNTAHDYYFGASTPPPASSFTPGLVFNATLAAADAGVILGANIMRVEFAYGASAASLDATFDYYADRRIKILMLAGGGVSPTQAEAENMGNWADRFGPGGTFWTLRGADGDLAVTHIEWGNEISYSYRSGTRGSPGYVAIAANYATRFQQAVADVTATGKNVGMLCIADADGSDNASWVNTLFNTVPSIASLVALRGGGWVCHTYGPTYPQRINTTASAVAARGAPSSIPIDITEVGVASAECPPGTRRQISDNYGWAKNMTYSEAAVTLRDQVTATRTGTNGVLPANSARIRHFMLYQARDNKDQCGGIITGDGTPDREGFFGGLLDDNAPKGAYTTQVQTTLNL